jgi:hypothetical protein
MCRNLDACVTAAFSSRSGRGSMSTSGGKRLATTSLTRQPVRAGMPVRSICANGVRTCALIGRAAVEATPRHLFIPCFYVQEQHGTLVVV